MKKVAADTGWNWVKTGFQLFRQQPMEILSLFFGYVFLILLIGLIPIVGQFLPMILVPVFSMSFMHACVSIEKGQKVRLKLLFSGFESPAYSRLLVLGCLYVIAALGVVALSALFDGGALLDYLSNKKPPDPKDPSTMPQPIMFWGMLSAALAYIPALMCFWYAAALITWQNMSVPKAIFYSFHAVRSAGKAFMVFGLSWLLVGVFLPTFLSLLVVLIVGQPNLAVIIMMPVSLGLTAVMYCSFYPTYTEIFGKPDLPD